MTRRAFLTVFAAIVVLAAVLRFIWPLADPPWRTTVGIVWHDEGAWVHNARNMALFGTWRLDNWNPLFVAPVFTGLEYLSFAAFGVGLWQARLVSQLLGLVSVVAMGSGVARTNGRFAGLLTAALVATGYVHVMYGRAATLEAAMIGFVACAWCCGARAEDEPRWGVAAGIMAWLAYFAKASAVFFVGALGAVSLLTIAQVWYEGQRRVRPEGVPQPTNGGAAALWCDQHARAAIWTLFGLAAGAIAALVFFVGPHWHDYHFYNWEMSVTRRPAYTLRALADRASWFPIVHDVFTRGWLTTVVGVLTTIGIVAKWRTARIGERLLVAWIVLGALELLARDVGNERYFVMLLPALAALTGIGLGSATSIVPPSLAAVPRRHALLALPVVLFVAYVVVAPLARLPFLYEVRPAVRLAAAGAVLVTAAIFLSWPRPARWLATPVGRTGAAVIVALVVAGDLVQFGQWAAWRTYKNYEASRSLADILPEGTLVQGKLANGLALENRIKPIFIGREFGNYADRLERDDVRYLLTYSAPRLGYEGAVVLDLLAAYPDRKIVWSADVAETTTGHDRAVLFEKGPRASGTDLHRAKD